MATVWRLLIRALDVQWPTFVYRNSTDRQKLFDYHCCLLPPIRCSKLVRAFSIFVAACVYFDLISYLAGNVAVGNLVLLHLTIQIWKSLGAQNPLRWADHLVLVDQLELVLMLLLWLSPLSLSENQFDSNYHEIYRAHYLMWEWENITLCCRRCGRVTSRVCWPAFVTSLATTNGSNRYFMPQIRMNKTIKKENGKKLIHHHWNRFQRNAPR